jgi:nucleoside-diphosphate-sugar epimerase
MMSHETFLITGALGCIGAWIMRNLIDEGVNVVAMDLANDPIRPRLLLSAAELELITFARTDITDLAAVRSVVEQEGVTHIIHLAGLQVPACKANPSLGAQVNVIGAINLFEAVRHCQHHVRGLVYASSVAVLGPAHRYPHQPIPDDAPPYPDTLYGVYKQTNEHTARLYWQDWQVGSIGLRPYIVYGAGRDQGLTSGIAKAILAAAAGRSYEIGFNGPVALQYANDVAQMFIAAARTGHQGAAVCNLRNDVIDVADFITLLEGEIPNVQVSATGTPLPFPADLDDANLRQILGQVPHTPLTTAIHETLDQFRRLLNEGLIDLGQLDG